MIPEVTAKEARVQGEAIIYGRHVQVLLFSAHISYGKGKYLNQTGFFTKFAKNYCLCNMKKYNHRIQLT